MTNTDEIQGLELEDVDRLFAKDDDEVTHDLFIHKSTVDPVEVPRA